MKSITSIASSASTPILILVRRLLAWQKNRKNKEKMPFDGSINEESSDEEDLSRSLTESYKYYMNRGVPTTQL